MQTPENEERIVPMRLQKFLARAGAASRRGSEDLMTAGRVCVNGQVATELGTKVDPLVDVVTVDGRVVSLSDGNVYLVLNKPGGAPRWPRLCPPTATRGFSPWAGSTRTRRACCSS